MSESSSRRPDSAPRESRWDVLDLLVFVWRTRLAWLCGAGLGAAIAVVLAVLQPTVYTARVTLLPAAEQAPAGILGQLASLTGTSFQMNANYEVIYSEIVLSDTVLDSLLSRSWRFKGQQEPATLYEIFEIDEFADSPQPLLMRRHQLMQVLREDVIAFVRNKMTGFMEIRVTAPEDPEFAAAMANRLADTLDYFNREIRVSQARDQRQFIEERLEYITETLNAAQDSVTTFEATNRGFLDSPDLRARHRALQREMEAQSAVWVELRRQVELARIEENKSRSTLTVLDRASIPVTRSGPGILLFFYIGVVLGALVGLSFMILRELFTVFRIRIRHEADLPVDRAPSRL